MSEAGGGKEKSASAPLIDIRHSVSVLRTPSLATWHTW